VEERAFLNVVVADQAEDSRLRVNNRFVVKAAVFKVER